MAAEYFHRQPVARKPFFTLTPHYAGKSVAGFCVTGCVSFVQ
jgi:hypothetical protein